MTNQMDRWILKGLVGILQIVHQRMDLGQLDQKVVESLREELNKHRNLIGEILGDAQKQDQVPG